MKIYISADIEGVVGISNWDEARKESKGYDKISIEMTNEVVKCCEGFLKAGVKEILIKDAHGTGRNIDPSLLPENTRLISGWTGHPYRMVECLDESFDAIAFVGYHSCGGSNNNPLAHTINSSKINYIKINNKYASEFLIHSYVAAYYKVPIVFLSGDKGICNEAKNIVPNIECVETLEGIGHANISISTKETYKKIKEAAKKSISKNIDKNILKLPEKFLVEISYMRHYDAYKNSFYPGIEQKNEKTLVFETKNYFELMRTLHFII